MKENIRYDHKLILSMIRPGAKVLDLGCGEGDLLQLLAQKNNADVQGIELDEKAVYKCVEKGVSVFHGDMESGLSGFPDKSFDYVVLNQSMQQARHVDFVLEDALRVADKVIVGFPNFAFLQARARLFFRGKVPITASLPYRWFDTPNLHFLSLTDFADFCKAKNIKVLQKYYFGEKGAVFFFPNLFALNAIFVITR